MNPLVVAEADLVRRGFRQVTTDDGESMTIGDGVSMAIDDGESMATGDGVSMVIDDGESMATGDDVSDHSSLVGVLYRSLHRDQQGKKGSLFPEAKQI
jgi:hypothetical protein